MAVKQQLSALQEKGLVKEWELPNEHLLTRLTAAVFFLTPAASAPLNEVWDELAVHKMLKYRQNEEKKLSKLEWRVEFNKDFVL